MIWPPSLSLILCCVFYSGTATQFRRNGLVITILIFIEAVTWRLVSAWFIIVNANSAVLVRLRTFFWLSVFEANASILLYQVGQLDCFCLNVIFAVLTFVVLMVSRYVPRRWFSAKPPSQHLFVEYRLEVDATLYWFNSSQKASLSGVSTDIVALRGSTCNVIISHELSLRLQLGIGCCL